MYTQHPPAYMTSPSMPGDSTTFFSHPFEFGAPPFGNFSPNTTLSTISPNATTQFKSQPGLRPPSLGTTSTLTDNVDNHASQPEPQFEPDFGTTSMPYSDDVFDITASTLNHDGFAIITTQADDTYASRTPSWSAEPNGLDE
jgi:hypothetical protein